MALPSTDTSSVNTVEITCISSLFSTFHSHSCKRTYEASAWPAMEVRPLGKSSGSQGGVCRQRLVLPVGCFSDLSLCTSRWAVLKIPALRDRPRRHELLARDQIIARLPSYPVRLLRPPSLALLTAILSLYSVVEAQLSWPRSLPRFRPDPGTSQGPGPTPVSCHP